MSARQLILIVEDNEANQLLTRSVLELEGYAVEVAGSANEAFEVLRERTPDLILMDIQLPGEDGLAATKRLKAYPATATIPVVALTAHAMAGDREHALAAGCAGYISKPIDTRTFGMAVKEFLRMVDRDRPVLAS
ncbi:MAG: response regulator [Chloroflexi bacterium]|nr:MAG: response regulator [Chloroflexota bacterium]